MSHGWRRRTAPRGRPSAGYQVAASVLGPKRRGTAIFSNGASLAGGTGWATLASRGDNARKQLIAIRSSLGPGRAGIDLFSITLLFLPWRLVVAEGLGVTARAIQQSTVAVACQLGSRRNQSNATIRRRNFITRIKHRDPAWVC